MIQMTKLHMGHPGVSPEEIYQIRYGMSMWLLQENAGLTYKEARVYLAFMRNESVEQLAEALGVKRERIYGLRASGEKKVEKMSEDDIFRGYFPMTMETCSPARKPFF